MTYWLQREDRSERAMKVPGCNGHVNMDISESKRERERENLGLGKLRDRDMSHMAETQKSPRC